MAKKECANCNGSHQPRCVTLMGTDNTTAFLADGTKVVIHAGKGSRGPMWLAIEPQAILRIQKKGKEKR